MGEQKPTPEEVVRLLNALPKTAHSILSQAEQSLREAIKQRDEAVSQREELWANYCEKTRLLSRCEDERDEARAALRQIRDYDYDGVTHDSSDAVEHLQFLAREAFNKSDSGEGE